MVKRVYGKATRHLAWGSYSFNACSAAEGMVIKMQNSVVQWLETTAKRFPERIAFVDEKKQYTWSELRRTALSIAAEINAAVRDRKVPVAVYMEKSADMLAAYMGIAYSGDFYSPIDTDMPRTRVEKILQTLQPAAVVTTRELAESAAGLKELYPSLGNVLCFEDMTGQKVGDDKAKEYADRILDTDLLYVLFTSGSTGTPKGVAIRHRSVIDYIDWVTDEFSITENDSFGNQAPFYFDNSILDIYSALKTGAALYIIPSSLFSQPVKLLQFLVDNKITTIFWVPSALIVVSRLKAFRNVDVSKYLKRVLFCGEVMPNKQLNIWRTWLPGVLYANLYGPTEITDACTFYTVDRAFSDDEPLPIGRPMRNTEILVLDENDRLVAGPEQIGELCVRGTSLAAGYYNDPERTAAAFVQNPLQTAYQEKIYRTGDLVKYNDRHELIYLSRKDFQIKHLGHRIELGEIETAVSSLEEISMCCCLYDDINNKIVLFLEQEFRRSEINGRIRDLIPDYMLPGKVVCVDKLPLNANGKIDRVRLRKEYIEEEME